MMSEPEEKELRIKIPPFYKFLVSPHRYKSVYGGRGSARSWTFARLLSGLATAQKKRILCTREFQSSIRESVHQILTNQIDLMGLNPYYNINRESIKSTIGSEFIFKGLRMNPLEIKSLEGIDICWIEEAQSVSNESWEILIPTIRKDGSEIWMSWNTGETSDPTYQRFVINKPDDCISVKATYRDNPYFPAVLERERAYLQRVDPDAYDHVWEGNPKSISDACIFKGKFVIDEFEAPPQMRLYYGADWGFADDPTTLIRSYIIGTELFIEYEAYGVGVELDEIAELFDSVPDSRSWRIKGDNQRPDTIKHVRNKGFDIVPCLKWPSGPGKKGSVKEGIEFLRKFTVIHIHQRCKHTVDEFRLYAYKTDSKTGEVLPIVVDKHNHCIDALRYAYDQKIKGGVNWEAVVGE
jgi:phage terminase large subunit